MNAPLPASEVSAFYKDLKPFSSFSEITEDRHFQPIPQDWCVVISDVKGSTAAIEAGRYKDVNTIGAATIAVAQNALKGMEFPFVFGGDGATLIVPGACRERVSEKLAALRNLSLRNFGLELRAGIVEVSEIVGDTATIEVAKFELVPGKSVAILRGGGLTRAEKRIKDSSGKYEIPKTESLEVDMDGLSCRWRDIPNRRGCILSMLVAADENASDPKRVYLDLLEEMRSVFSSSIQASNPVDLSSMSYLTAGQCLRNERRFHPTLSLASLSRYLEIVLTNAVFRWKRFPKFLTPRGYLNSMRDHSDYRKFDDMLRMIIDCSPAEVEKLESYLAAAHRKGALHYGLHQSETSLMTCYVQSIADGDHIHFIDGGGGGYAMAAKQLKSQMAASGGAA